ncbi:hypothetical protein ACVWY3_004362 [Bradyrhizobium sp. USDA 4486]
MPHFPLSCPAKAGHPVLRGVSVQSQPLRRTGSPAFAGDDSGGCSGCLPPNAKQCPRDSCPHNSLAFENAKLDTRLVVSSRISVRVIGGSARWAQFSRSQRRQLTPIGVPSVFSRSVPAA